MQRDIKVEIKSLPEVGADFIAAWRSAEKGDTPAVPVERIFFEDVRALAKVLTPRRIETLKTLHDNGPLAIRALARLLNRDYKNVNQDIQLLLKVGLVEKTDSGLVVAPFEKIVAEIQLAA